MVTAIATMADNNSFSFNMCDFVIISDFKKSSQTFSNSVKWNPFSKFEFIALKVVFANLFFNFNQEHWSN